MPITRAYGQASQLGNTPAASNPVINGAFDIWQRGTSIAGADSTSNYTADRWVGYRTNSTYSRQSVGDTTNLPTIQYCMRVQRNSGNTSTNQRILWQSLETVDSIRYAGQTVTLSFYARAGSNYSPTSSILRSDICTGTGTDQNLGAGFTGQVTNSQNNTLTTTWQRFTQTYTVGATATQLGIEFVMEPTGTAGANDFYEVTGIQIDRGSVALPFRRTGGTLAGELAAACRYYQKLNPGTGTDYYVYGTGGGATTGVAQFLIPLPIQMRTAPSSIDYANLATYDFTTVVAPTNVTLISASTPNVAGVNANKTSTYTVGKFYQLLANNSNASYLAFNAEL